MHVLPTMQAIQDRIRVLDVPRGDLYAAMATDVRGNL